MENKLYLEDVLHCIKEQPYSRYLEDMFIVNKMGY